ncbi:MAG: hybrid sensor histidine kinase/response regulator [Acidobacteriota bacterium]
MSVPMGVLVSGQDLSGFSMMDLFRTEAEAQTAILTEGLLALEREPSATERLEPLMRAAHSLKGAARIVGLDQVVVLAHALEDCFVAAQHGALTIGSEQADLLLKAVDLLARLANIPEADAPSRLMALQGQIDETVRRLGEVKSGSPPPPATEPKAMEPPPAVKPPEPAAAVKPAASPRDISDADRAVRVTAENLTRMMGLAGETLVQSRRMESVAQRVGQLARHHAELSRLIERAGSVEELPSLSDVLSDLQQRVTQAEGLVTVSATELDEQARQSLDASERLYRSVIGSRMRPFADGTQGFARMVRDLARELGKKVRFEILGKSTEVDRDVLEKLEAPLTHLLRNSLDHGLELPEERVACGKNPEGALRLEATHRAGQLYLTVSDDGRGIDVERLRQKVVSQGLEVEDVAKRLTETELLEFIFLPGFSTAERLSEISGRGVGLDVVRALTRELGGGVQVENHAGRGLTFHLRLPVTHSVLRTLLFEVANEPFALPLNRIRRLAMVDPHGCQTLEGRPYVVLDEGNVGLVDAREVLELTAGARAAAEWAAVILEDRDGCYGLVVDRFLGESELVVRPMDPRLGKVADVSAVSTLGDGSPVLILDAEDLSRSISKLLSGGALRKVGRAGAESAKSRRKRILVVDDSITVRELERKLLRNSGYEVETCVDGTEAWNAVRVAPFDLIVSDVDMPRMDGIELVRRIKQDARLSATPVIIVSYKDRDEDRMRGLEAGATHYLTKSSFHDESFVRAVKDLIGEAES